MKKCFKCGEVKTLSDFYKHKAMGDGHLNKCKECTKEDVRERRRTNPKVQEYDRLRGNRQDPDYQKQYRKRYPNKYKAHRLINNGIRDGKISSKNSCEECFSEFSVEAHHDDYSKPLDVRWLCALCHKRWHSKNGEGLNP